MYPSSQDKELFLDILTKEEREALLSKKLEAMKKKNQLIKKRYEEVEADKRVAAENAAKTKVPGQQESPRSKDTKFLYTDERKHHQGDDRKAHFSDERKAQFSEERKPGRHTEEPSNLPSEERRSKSAGRGKQLAKFSQKELKAQDINIVVVNEDALYNNDYKDEPRRSGKFHGRQDSRENKRDSFHENKRDSFHENKRDSWHENKRDSWNDERRAGKNDNRRGNHQDHRKDDFHEHRRDDFHDHRRDDFHDHRRDDFHDHRRDEQNDRSDKSRKNNSYSAMKKSPQDSGQRPGHFHPYERKQEDVDGPPPDPSYNFLSDRRREGPPSQENQERSRRHPQNFGGTNFETVKDKMKHDPKNRDGRFKPQSRNKMEMAVSMTGRERRQYSEWRSERDRVDQERIDRQKCNSGEWRRAWDAEKFENFDEPASNARTEPAKRPAGRIGSGRFAHSEIDERARSDSTGAKAGVAQSQEVIRRPSGRGRGRGRGRGASTENKEPRPPRHRSNSDEGRIVERQHDSLVIKVENSPDKNGSVEVSYSEDYDTLRKKGKSKRSTTSSAVQTPDDESWHSETNSHPDSHDERGSSSHSRDKHIDGEVNVDNDDSWEDATEDSSDVYGTTGESEDGQPVDGGNRQLKVDCSLNPDAPEFTPVSPELIMSPDLMKTPPGIKKVEDWADTSLSPRSPVLSPTYQVPVELLAKKETPPKIKKSEEPKEENVQNAEVDETDMTISKETLQDSAEEEDPDTETYGYPHRGSDATVSVDGEKLSDEFVDGDIQEVKGASDDENDDDFVAANGDANSNGGVDDNVSPRDDAADHTGHDSKSEGDNEKNVDEVQAEEDSRASNKSAPDNAGDGIDDAQDGIDDAQDGINDAQEGINEPRETEKQPCVLNKTEDAVGEASAVKQMVTEDTSADSQSEIDNGTKISDADEEAQENDPKSFKTVKYVHSKSDEESQKNDSDNL